MIQVYFYGLIKLLPVWNKDAILLKIRYWLHPFTKTNFATGYNRFIKALLNQLPQLFHPALK